MRRTKSEWQDVLTKMIETGATGSETDFEKVFGFLRRHYGKVYINAADARRNRRRRWVSRRRTRTPSPRIERRTVPSRISRPLKKVPDIDVKTLEAHRDAVAF